MIQGSARMFFRSGAQNAVVWHPSKDGKLELQCIAYGPDGYYRAADSYDATMTEEALDDWLDWAETIPGVRVSRNRPFG